MDNRRKSCRKNQPNTKKKNKGERGVLCLKGEATKEVLRGGGGERTCYFVDNSGKKKGVGGFWGGFFWGFWGVGGGVWGCWWVFFFGFGVFGCVVFGWGGGGGGGVFWFVVCGYGLMSNEGTGWGGKTLSVAEGKGGIIGKRNGL